MNKVLQRILPVFGLLISVASMLVSESIMAETSPEAPPKFTGTNYSGSYLCKGSNLSVGEYEVNVELKLNVYNSHDKIGVYDFTTETENRFVYLGQAVTNGTQMALTFKLKEAKHAEFSTGNAEFKKLPNRRWSFKNNYYEPDDSGGNYGSETCVMQNAALPSKKANSLRKNKLGNVFLLMTQKSIA